MYLALPSFLYCTTETCIYSLEDMMALRKLRQARQGIDSSKLAMGDPKKRKTEDTEDSKGSTTTAYGLQKPKDDDADQ